MSSAMTSGKACFGNTIYYFKIPLFFTTLISKGKIKMGAKSVSHGFFSNVIFFFDRRKILLRSLTSVAR
jgi:hypothetical protein